MSVKVRGNLDASPLLFLEGARSRKKYLISRSWVRWLTSLEDATLVFMMPGRAGLYQYLPISCDVALTWESHDEWARSRSHFVPHDQAHTRETLNAPFDTPGH